MDPDILETFNYHWLYFENGGENSPVSVHAVKVYSGFVFVWDVGVDGL